MNILFHRSFRKDFERLPHKQREKFKERVALYEVNSAHPLLRLHALSGKYQGCWSIDVTGDVRAIYEYIPEDDVVLFVRIGTHSELYGM